jgi:hypothetical protein
VFTGTKSVSELAARAPTMPRLDTEPMTLHEVELLTVTYEVAASDKEAVLPAGLHPTNPPIITWQFLACADGPLGPFHLAQTRIECRSGARPRAFLVSAVVDSDVAASDLSARWGYACRPGHVALRRFYDRVLVTVTLADDDDQQVVLDLELVDPVALRNSDIQWIANMNLAHTPRGLRLVQVDPEITTHRAERFRPAVGHFDAAAWGEPLLRPVYAVAATRVIADITFPRLRYLCAPDQFAFGATEVLES